MNIHEWIVPVHGEHDHRDEDDRQDHEDDDEEVEVHTRGLTRQHILHVAAVLLINMNKHINYLINIRY